MIKRVRYNLSNKPYEQRNNSILNLKLTSFAYRISSNIEKGTNNESNTYSPTPSRFAICDFHIHNQIQIKYYFFQHHIDYFPGAYMEKSHTFPLQIDNFCNKSTYSTWKENIINRLLIGHSFLPTARASSQLVYKFSIFKFICFSEKVF